MLKTNLTKLFIAFILLCVTANIVKAQTAPDAVTLKIDAGKVTAHVSPTLYGIMTEEINHSYDGGLYGELIQNRIFKDDPNTPVHWSLVSKTEGAGSIALDNAQPINDSLTVSLRLDAATKASKDNVVGISNDGFWGIPVKPATVYTASFYAKAKDAASGPLTVTLESNDGNKTLAQATLKSIGTSWKKYTVTLTTAGNIVASINNHFTISVQKPGTIWFNLVSLFPPTYNNRKNGNRVDIMQKLADLHPSFLRCPGGNYVEGSTMATYYNWKKTIGDLSVRPGHPGTWKYRSSDGLGILEYMEWCEDLKIQPVLAIFAGYTLNKEHVDAGPGLQKFVDEALDELEYITGDAKTKWGAQRVADGHPAPFVVNYVEIGNEDFFDKSGSYDGRFAQFYDAIKAKYPKLQLIATTAIKSRTPDLLDDHFYKRPQEFEHDTHHYDAPEKRNGPKIFVGEWAARTGDNVPTPNLNCALGDAAWMTGMERNTDLVLMASYAPLFANVNKGAWQWRINMIGYDALNSYGSPSYYAQQMFYNNIGDVVIATDIDGVPTVPYIPAPPRQPGNAAPVAPPAPSTMPSLSYVVTKNTKTGIIYLKMVNIKGDAQTVHINLDGVKGVQPDGTAITLSGKPEDTNTIDEPLKIVPITVKINNISSNFNYTFAPYSVTILQLHTR